jgi:hypothetical protein
MTDVLVVRRGGLGDTLVMTPLLRSAAAPASGRGLHLAGVRSSAEILLQHGVVDRVLLSSEDLARAARWRANDWGRYAHIVSDGTIAIGRRRDYGANVRSTAAHGGADRAASTPSSSASRVNWPDDAWLLPARPKSSMVPVMLAPWQRQPRQVLAARALARARTAARVSRRSRAGRRRARRAGTRRSAGNGRGPIEVIVRSRNAKPRDWRVGSLRAAAFVGNDSGPFAPGPRCSRWRGRRASSGPSVASVLGAPWTARDRRRRRFATSRASAAPRSSTHCALRAGARAPSASSRASARFSAPVGPPLCTRAMTSASPAAHSSGIQRCM